MHLHASVVIAGVSFIAQTSYIFPERYFLESLTLPYTPLASCMALFAIKGCLYSYVVLLTPYNAN